MLWTSIQVRIGSSERFLFESSDSEMKRWIDLACEMLYSAEDLFHVKLRVNRIRLS